MKNRYGIESALKDFVLGGSKISKLEALVLFGVQDLSREMKRLKDNGFIVKKRVWFWGFHVFICTAQICV